MMQAIMETAFDIVYLFTVTVLGIRMILGNRGPSRMFGWMALLLGAGDAFHLVPRAYALCTDGLAAHAAALGIGKCITSITMTGFYVLLYLIGRKRYDLRSQTPTVLVGVLAVARILLCLLPQNQWTARNPPLLWGIYRNIPFLLLGLLVLVLFYLGARQSEDREFRWLWLAVTLSFAFYIPVVLWAETVPLVGMLMIPKTCAYVWIVVMGYRDMQKRNG